MGRGAQQRVRSSEGGARSLCSQPFMCVKPASRTDSALGMTTLTLMLSKPVSFRSRPRSPVRRSEYQCPDPLLLSFRRDPA